MIATALESLDVFLSHSLIERDDAQRVAHALADAGMNVFDSATRVASGSSAEEIWNAMAVSDAFVVVEDPRISPSANVQVELGAALGWQKPIFVVRTDDGAAAKPVPYLRKFPTYPQARILDLIAAIRSTAASFGEEDRALLVETYLELGVPTDRLLTDPALVDDLLQRFRSKSKAPWSGERLVQELIRIRKAGTLPRLRK